MSNSSKGSGEPQTRKPDTYVTNVDGNLTVVNSVMIDPYAAYAVFLKIQDDQIRMTKELIRREHELIRKDQEQFDRLLTIIEKRLGIS